MPEINLALLGVSPVCAGFDTVDSTFEPDPSYPHQMVPILYGNGATGTIKNISVSGAYLSKIVIRGEDTNVLIDDNAVIGLAPKCSGWVQNGIKTDNNANANMMNNLIENHVWEKPY